MRRVILFCITLTAFTIVHAQKNVAPDKKRAMDLLRKNLAATGLTQSVLNDYVVTDAYLEKKSGDFIVYLQQGYLGVPVYNKIGVFIFRHDTLAEKTPNFISKLPVKAGTKATYTINPALAIRNAAQHVAIPLTREPRVLQVDNVRKKWLYSTEAPMTVTSLTQRNIHSDLVWLPVNDGAQVKLSWNVRIGSADGKQDWMVRIDAQTGEVLGKSNLVVSEKGEGDLPVAPLPTPPAPPAVNSAGYRVFPFPLESGNYGNRAVDTDPWLKAGVGNNAATLGWHFDNSTNYEYTRGNNVWAQEDLAGNSATTGISDTSSTSIPALTFDRAINTALNPATASNLRAGVDNLFYWNNLMHDISYQYGFDEAAGNFQASNQGRGGQEGDYVSAFALDGTGINNANFATPPDGENPRMRMFQWAYGLTHHLHINAPAPINVDYLAAGNTINFKTQLLDKSPLTGDIVLVQDTPPGTSLGCGIISNASSLVGKIALVSRGSCNFVVKIKSIQNAGAIAVIIINTSAGVPTAIGGTDSTLTIPAIMISSTAGDSLKANLTGLNGTLSVTGIYRDGALDNGVISHEYTHGISNRLTGGPANADCLNNAEQMGEGWSDYVALMVTTNWATANVLDSSKRRPIGTYVLNQDSSGSGIRTYPYSTNMGFNPWTYAMLAGTNGEAHTVGEIWCAALWDMTWNIIGMEGIDPDIYHGTRGNNIALQLVLQGLKYQPCGPGFLDGRDAILKADSLLYNYAHKCAIWNAFAKRGMGKSASQGSASSYTDQTAAFDLPSGVSVSQTVNKTQLTHGDNITYTVRAYCDCSPRSGISIVDTLAGGLSYVTSSGGTYTAPYVHFDGVSFAANETKTFTIQANVTGNYSQPDTMINDSRDPASYTWATAATTGGTQFSESTTRWHSNAHAWYASDQATNTDFTLTSGILTLDTVSTLSFWHYYETDATYDGGVVELSRDGGSTWQDLGPYITQNGYNSNLDRLTPGLASRKAFSGSSGGVFLQTVITMTGLAGTNNKIRFRFASDASVGEEGWYIDDVLLKSESGVVNMTNAFSGGTLLSGQKTFTPFASVPLPVNFVDVRVTRQGDAALVHWKVSEEMNVAKYIVERSADGRSFSAIGEVGVNVSGSDYYFTDQQPLQGAGYYRIAEVDLDGKRTYSEVRVINFSASGIGVRVSPVPTYNHTVQVDVATGDDAAVTGLLINTIGKTLKVYSLKQGLNTLDLEDFAKGVYFLKVQTSRNEVEIRKLVIQ